MEIKEKPPISPDKSVVTPATPVADSGAPPAANPSADTPPADLAGLREWNASRNPSSIIADKVATLRERLADPSTPPAAIPGLEAAIRRVEKQRDPAAQARMAAKVAVDKLEARLAALAEDRRVDEEARKLLDHARDQGGTLEMALEDFRDFDKTLLGEMGERVLNRAQDLDGEGATSAPRRRYRSSLNPYRRGDY